MSQRAIRSNRFDAEPVLAVIALFVSLAPLQTAAAQNSGGAVPPPVATRESLDNLNARAKTPDRVLTGLTGALPSGTLVWTFLGPQPITNEYWSGNANASGRATSIAVDPTNGNTAYVATAGGGVWKTTDGGMTWTVLTDQLSSIASGAVALDPANTTTVLYGTGEQNYSGDSFYGDGAFLSADGGTTWTKIGLKTDVGSYIARVNISSGGGVLHICSDRGYVRSTDGGTSWAAFQPGGGWCNDLVRSVAISGTLFAGFNANGVYKSTDDGASWTKLSGGLPSSGFQRINLGIGDSDANVVYASLIDGGGALFGMYRTTDGGTTWTRLSTTPNYVCTQGWYDNAVAVSATDSNTVYAAGVFPYCTDGGIIKSTNGGSSWTNVTIAGGTQVHPDNHALTFGPDGALWVGSDGGVWKTTNGAASWIDLNQGLGTALFYSVGIHSSDPTVLIGGTQDNGAVQYQGGPAWPQIIGGDGGPVAWEWANPDLYYTTYVMMNPLYQWLRPLAYQATVTGPWGGERADWGNGPLVVDPNLPNTVLVGTYHVWQSPDSGASWSLISPSLTNGVLRALAVSPADSNTIYSGGSDGQAYVTSDRWTSTLTSIAAGLPPGRTIPDIVAHPLDPLTAYVCVDQSSGSRVFQTSDGGVTWQDLTGNLPPGLRALSLAIDFTGSVFYLGTDFGVYSSADGGNTWTQEALGLPNLPVYQVRIDVTNGLLVAATHGRGVWEAPLTGGMGAARRRK